MSQLNLDSVYSEGIVPHKKSVELCCFGKWSMCGGMCGDSGARTTTEVAYFVKTVKMQEKFLYGGVGYDKSRSY
jgi:hypothetical protein